MDPNQSQESKPTTIVERIEAGETREFDGPVEVESYVGQGATVKVKDGGIIVKGDVHDGAKISSEIQVTSVNIGRISGNSISISDISISGSNSGSVVVTGSGGVLNSVSIGSSAGTEGVNVLGKIGNNVTIKSDSQVKISGSGDELKAKCENSFTSKGDIGNNSFVDAGNALTVTGSVGKNSTLKSGNSTTIGNVGANSSLEAGNSLTAAVLSEGVSARSGNSLTASHIGEGAKISAGNKVTASVAHVSAQISAGNKTNIGSYQSVDLAISD